MPKIVIKRVDDAFGFEATDETGHSAHMDAAESFGGHNSGIRPMQTLLMGLGGCGGVDIVSILKKQKQELIDFTMEISGERETGKEPSLWQKIHIVFYLTGNIDPEKAEKAVSLSIDKYCSVAATLRAAGAVITYEVRLQ